MHDLLRREEKTRNRAHPVSDTKMLPYADAVVRRD